MRVRLLTAAEVAAMLNVSPATVLDWHEQGKLPSYKLGKAVRFREDEIVAWLEGQRVTTQVDTIRGGV